MKLALRFALRDLRGGLTGLRLLAICLFLGVAGLAGVGSLTSAIGAAISEQGQALLGGDIEYKILQREANVDELSAFTKAGSVSTVMRTRATAVFLRPIPSMYLPVSLVAISLFGNC